MSDEVQVTPELLRLIEDNANNGAEAHKRIAERLAPHGITPPTINGQPAYAVVLALVKRIRELESMVGRHGTLVPELREPTFRT